MKHVTKEQVVRLHQKVIEVSGGGAGIRAEGALESSVAQPLLTFDGLDLYPTVAEKAAALGHSLIANHPFVDGNKRIGHAALEVLLVINGFEIQAHVDEQERIILAVASGHMKRPEFIVWVPEHVVEKRKS
ncbi:MAG: type II toxin-antitoxin system death-on-curing family toxin [Blastocatellia bacterium]|nr:type II toxin-antitoxin system death-on-curing family toxin [Blastocatellia bacterium]